MSTPKKKVPIIDQKKKKKKDYNTPISFEFKKTFDSLFFLNLFTLMEISRINHRQMGLSTTQAFSKGQIVHVLEGDVLNYPTRTSIEIVAGLLHIEDKMGRYINHCFDPTCFIDGRNVVALRDLAPGDEITFDYNHNESNMACPFHDADTGRHVRGYIPKLE